MNIDEAIGILEKDEPDNYMGKFIKERDKLFLINAKKIIGIKNS